MGAGTYLRNLRTLSNEYRNVTLMGVFGFFFFLFRGYSLRTTSIPGGLLFCWSAVFLFWVSWFHLKHKGTDAYGKTITFDWEDPGVPEWKKWAAIAWVVIFLLLFCWIVTAGFFGGLSSGTLCLGNCGEY